jgi:DNA polymerase-3 subunit gamma/tau
MSDQSPVTTSDGVASLYRRFRPGRFAELRGQDHVVRALLSATTSGRVVHAYLFSGPRGTGKTTAARILAKALNCEHPLEGDACDACDSCRAITRGASLDVIELDAASNNGVDDIREITAGAWHGTPGRWKVYIVDEVHQLSKAASAALLKTLEEPPAHVVFVLATTDPHRVLPTIRSRTQHLEFRLLAGDTLGELLRDVRERAALTADDAVLDAAVRLGRGSARDALSALDQMVATGDLGDARPSFDGLFNALSRADASAALGEVAVMVRNGWDPEQLIEGFLADVRQVFLLLVAPEVADAVDTDRARLAAWGEQLGLARTVRVLETLGRALREMKSAVERLVTLEVALVRLVRPDVDISLEALEVRVSALERAERTAAAPPAAPRAPIGARSSTAEAVTPPPARPSVEPASSSGSVAPATVAPSALTDLDDVRRRFEERVVPRTARSAQLLLRGARVHALDDQRLTLAVANEELRQHADVILPGLRGALEHEFKTPLVVEIIVDPAVVAPATSSSRAPRRAPAPVGPQVDDDVDGGEEGGDPGVVVESVAEHLIAEVFPGAQEL